MRRVTRTGSPEVLRVCDSSPDSAETSFRELDDVFLQTQTRIWLGEVLQVRFSEDVGIADLLADGELLFQVSKEVWNMLLRKHGELKHSKVHIYERTSFGKSEGRYMPYPKVDSFLKICQILGLTGIDLFSPSEVVEKRDIRRVCMCIRSFSKKARSKNLSVPDFDIVTYTIAMPTHLVGGICRDLELSRSSPSSSSASSPWNDAKEICGRKIPFGQRSQHSDSLSDESEKNFSDFEFESPFSSASYDCTDVTCIVGETSPELSPIADDFVHETSFNNCIKDSNHYEVDVYKANFMMDLNEDFIKTLVPVVQNDVDIAAHSLLLEEGKFCNDASYRSFVGHSTSSSGTEVRSFTENAEQVDAFYQSCQTHENPQVVVEGNSDEPGLCHKFHMSDYLNKNKKSKCALDFIENHGSSLNYTQGKDYCCICGLMADGSSISGLPCMVSIISEQQRNPEKEDPVEQTDRLFYDGISSVDDSDCSDELKMHQSSHDASDISFLLSDYESKVHPSKEVRATSLPDEESSVNPVRCQYDNGKTRDFGHQMTEKLNSFYAKDLDVLDVMESSDFASSICASEMIPNFDFYRYDIFQDYRNILEIKGETFQTFDILSSSTSACRERKEVASDDSIEVEKHVVSYLHDACAEPDNVPQTLLDTIMPDECNKSKDGEGITVGKTGSQVLKSVAGVMTMVGAFVLFLHVRQNKDKEKKIGRGIRFQIQKPNQEFFTTRKVKIGKSDSLYPGEKLKF